MFTAFQGAESTIVREGKDEIKVRVRLQEAFRNRDDTLNLLEVPNQSGRLISLAGVAHFERKTGLPSTRSTPSP